MPVDPGVKFFLFIVGVIGLAAIAYLVLLIARWNSNRVRYVAPRWREPAHVMPRVQRFYPPFDPEPEPEPEANPASERQNPEGTWTFTLNLDECLAIARMIEHKTTAEKPTKASTIWAGFAVKKGASARYQRASEIFDTLFIVQEEIHPTPIAERPTSATFAQH